MDTTIKTIITCLLLFTSAGFLFAQDTIVTHDLELWPSVKLEKAWDNGLAVSLEQEFRLGHNVSEVNKYFTQVGVEYEVNKYVAIGGAYRFIKNRNNDDVFEKQHRLFADLSLSYKFGKLGIGYRLRYQNQDDSFIASSDGDTPQGDIRNRIKLKYKIKKLNLTPFIGAELYRAYEKGESAFFSKVRYTIGTGYDFEKAGKINLFYRIQKELNVEEPKTRYILGLGYSYSF